MPSYLIERELPAAGFPANRISEVTTMIDPSTAAA
jgi:hypothetical protein